MQYSDQTSFEIPLLSKRPIDRTPKTKLGGRDVCFQHHEEETFEMKCSVQTMIGLKYGPLGTTAIN